MFTQLTPINHNNFKINYPVKFSDKNSISPELVRKCFEFSHSMTFGAQGTHRNYRSGGSHQRTNGEIFINAFQGKLAELAFYSFLFINNIKCHEPDIGTYNLGEWDNSDFTLKNKQINLKSTKFYGNLLLLKTKDWSKDGEYLANRTTKKIIV